MANLLGTTVNGRLYVTSASDVNPTDGAFRFYDGTTFRGGLGLDSWAHSGSSNDLTLYVANNGSLFITTNSIKRHFFNSGEAAFRTYAPDLNYKISVAGGDQLNAYYGSGATTLYIQYHGNAGGDVRIAGNKFRFDNGGHRLIIAKSNGTMISNDSMDDAIGWNSSYGTYIGSTVGGTSYLYANGTLYTGGVHRTLIHSGNIGSQSVNYAASAGDSTNLDGRSSSKYLYYRGISTTGDFQSFQSSESIIRFDQVNNYNGLSNPPGGYNYGGVLSMRGDNFGFQIWGSHIGDLYYKTQWGNDQYSGWRYIVHSGNIGSQSVSYANTSTNLYASGGAYIKSSTSGTSYGNHIQVREADGGSSNSSSIYEPALGFHWSGVVASNIAMESSGRIAIKNNPGTSYENFIANGIYGSIFYDSGNSSYYVDPNSTTSGYFAGVLRQNDGKYVRDAHYRTISGYGDLFSGGSAGWTTIAEITLAYNCSGAVLYGTLFDHRYDGADAYQLSIVARSECDFTSNNSSHYINVGCTITGSTAIGNYRDKIRVLLVYAPDGARTYELQVYETAWNHNTWQLESTGWTIYTSAQSVRTGLEGAKVNYISNQNADYQRANEAMYSPIYYDSNDTGYYVDPNSTSKLVQVNLGTVNTRLISNSGVGYLKIYGSASNFLGVGPYDNNGWVYFENIGNANGIYFNSPGRYAFDSVDVTPYTDNENSLGNGSYRWANIYTGGWLRNYGAQGMYNESYGTHFYSNGGASWAITGSGGNVELQFRSNHQSTIRGYVYADTSNQIGFLHSGGGWALRTTSDKNALIHGTDLTINADGAGSSNIVMNDGDEGSRTIHCNSNRIGFLNQSSSWGSWCNDNGSWATDVAMYSPIYYDSNDTNYYIDPNGYSQTSSIYANNWFRAQSNTGLYFSSYARGIWSADSAGASYGNVSIYGDGINSWPGYAINNLAIFMARDTRRGIFIPSADSWLIRYEESNNSAFVDFDLQSGSDIRYKSNIKRISGALGKVKQLKGVTYNYKGNKRTSIGFIAQEVEPILPEVVSTDADGFKGIGYANIVALLSEAIKEQQVMIDELRAEIDAIKSK